MKKIRLIISMILILTLITALFSACASSTGSGRTDDLLASLQAQSGDNGISEQTPDGGSLADQIQQGVSDAADMISDAISGLVQLKRPAIMQDVIMALENAQEPSVESYVIEKGLSNVTYADRVSFTDEQIEKLEQNGFVVSSGYNREFFELYENNRYMFFPNFVTVDSMLHLYHIYFSYLMKKTERNFLADELFTLSNDMLGASISQYDDLVGTEWESAAKRNVAFFAVGASLQGETEYEIPYYAVDQVKQELAAIEAADGIAVSALTDDFEDYSQYIPRGYYEGDPQLESYFKAMIWYGRLNFKQKDEDLNRSAFLMTLAMDESGALDIWKSIYVITSFFAGTSDDNGYYEYRPVIDLAYGEDISAGDLAGTKSEWEMFQDVTGRLPAPAINSVPVMDSESEESSMEKNTGFRFMGQRFSIDAAIFQQLIYSQVGNYEDPDKRMLPDVLDVPAAFGSELALDILDEKGDTSYPRYSEHMEKLRQVVAGASDEQWNVSLYSSWLNTLRPLTKEKGEGYPSFMTNKAWAAHNLETFAGSYTELKHDTVLYSKQVMAEMGGGPIPEYDDRGYVEPEPEVFYRLTLMTEKTKEGLKGYGMLSQEDEDNLDLFGELAARLQVIAEKELRNELLDDDEFELIRTYGGNLEHLWRDAMQDEAGDRYPTTKEFPASVITDIATDPNGSVLEVGTGNPSQIYVIVPIDGNLVLTSGTVYTFYQFDWPLNDRLTDSKWRQMQGIEVGGSGQYQAALEQEGITYPEWTSSFRQDR